MKRTLSFLAVVLCFAVGATMAVADNAVVVTSKSVDGGEGGVGIPILLTNDVGVRTVVVPLVIRSVTNGAFITSLAMSYGDRLPLNGPLSEYVGRNQYPEEDGDCKNFTPGGFRTIAYADGLPHPVAASPEAVMLTRFRIFGPDLQPGADLTGSMILTVDINAHDGVFEIDTTCTNPNNHIYFVSADNSGVVPEFTKGIITVGPALDNYPPVAHDDAYSAYTATTFTIGAPGVLANDSDPDGDPLTAVLVSGVSHGQLTLNADGSFLYVSAAGFEGADQFTYNAFDGTEYSNAPAVVTITVQPLAPDAPIAVDDYYTNISGIPLFVDPGNGVLVNDSDPNGDPLTAILDEGPGHGTLSFVSNGGFVYTATGGYEGEDEFTYYAFDGVVKSANPATVHITVLPSLGVPVAVDDHYALPSSMHLTVPAPGVLANDLNPSGMYIQAVLVDDVAAGTLVFHPNGSFDYVAGPSFIGMDSFTYYALSGAVYSPPATVTIWGLGMGGPPTPIEVALDIKPGSCPNPLNINFKGHGQKGVLPVAILGSPDFDVQSIVLSSVRLNGCAPVRTAIEDVAGPGGETTAEGCECTDAGPDGYDDFTLKFDKTDIADALGDVAEGDEVNMTIVGLLYDGGDFYGIDCVRIAGPNKQILKSDNHPNPFNAATTISYTLAEAADVRLEVFDLLGRKVATVVDAYRPAGDHEVVWNGRAQDGTTLASGVYFYRLRAGSESVTRKIVWLK